MLRGSLSDKNCTGGEGPGQPGFLCCAHSYGEQQYAGTELLTNQRTVSHQAGLLHAENLKSMQFNNNVPFDN
jgi:hypothetical protein